MAQRVGPVTIDDNNSQDDDLTVIQVPSEAVGFVTGSQGNFLRQVEEEWGTLMFFADFRGRGERQEVRHASASARRRRLRPRTACRCSCRRGARGGREPSRCASAARPCDAPPSSEPSA
jgi:hypothetical protein